MSAAAIEACRITLHLWPEQFQILLEAIPASALHTSDTKLKAQRQDLLDYLNDRAVAASAVKVALEAAPEDGDVDEVWRDVWIARVFEGREPTMEQVKRELYQYWELLERLGE